MAAETAFRESFFMDLFSFLLGRHGSSAGVARKNATRLSFFRGGPESRWRVCQCGPRWIALDGEAGAAEARSTMGSAFFRRATATGRWLGRCTIALDEASGRLVITLDLRGRSRDPRSMF